MPTMPPLERRRTDYRVNIPEGEEHPQSREGVAFSYAGKFAVMQNYFYFVLGAGTIGRIYAAMRSMVDKSVDAILAGDHIIGAAEGQSCLKRSR
jgi:hypothetical protein